MAKKLVTRSVLITGKRRYNHAKLLRVSGSNFSIFFRKLIDSKAEMVRFWFRHTEVRMRPLLRTSFHHQPEAQHPKSSAIHNNAGRLPHLLAHRVISLPPQNLVAIGGIADIGCEWVWMPRWRMTRSGHGNHTDRCPLFGGQGGHNGHFPLPGNVVGKLN